ncbi:d-3-phosphoglycerate dehydrogenase [Fusarium flagelliforme]|uniref:D-3-phosphoglycerate dehydrogenase n=1 Tax=Fusarium flagelliforme TaxID=2675880 RepID=A0A395MTB0_9HYPO|nr:d-3-phosphoglycerate dehydrogenase [Fusarium flagelliforme]
MTLIKATSNKSLKGHKAIIILNSEAPEAQIHAIKKQFPDLTIKAFSEKKRGEPLEPVFDEKEWEDTTIILTAVATSHLLPKPEQAPHLQYVQLTSAGADHMMDKPIFTDTKIPDVADDAGLKLLSGLLEPIWPIDSANEVKEYSKLQDEGKWKRISKNDEDTAGKRIGILGYGSIGRQTARVSKALGLDVHAYTLHPRDTPSSRRDESYSPPGLGDPEGEFPSKWFSGGSTQEIHAFLDSGLDILVIALPLTEKTKGLISKPEFEIFAKKGTFVINIARGPVVDTDDLIEALNNEVISGAALDVTDPEPLPEGHPLWSAKNVTITPHEGGILKYTMKKILETAKVLALI